MTREPFASALPASPAANQYVDSLIARMTLEEKAAQMQDSAPAIPRLGIPAYTYWNEALHGVARAGEATVFPQAIGMAATWDTGLIQAEGNVISTEGRAKYNQAQREGNTSRYFGLKSFGEIYGYAFGTFVLAGACGALLMGVGFDRTGSYTVPLVGFLAAICVAMILFSRLGPYRYGVHEPSEVAATYKVSAAGL